MVSTARQRWHHGAIGKSLQPTLAVGTITDQGVIIQVRRKKKYARRYLVGIPDGMDYSGGVFWLRRDELTPH